MFDAETSARIGERWTAVAEAAAGRRNHWHESWDEPLDALTAGMEAARKEQTPQAWRAVSVQGRAVREVLENNNDGAEHALYPLVTRLTDAIDKGLDALAGANRELRSEMLLAEVKEKLDKLEQATAEDRQTRKLWEVEIKQVLNEILAKAGGVRRAILHLEKLVEFAPLNTGIGDAAGLIKQLVEFVDKQWLVERIKAAGRRLGEATARFIHDARVRFTALKLPWRSSAADTYFENDANKGVLFIVRNGSSDSEIWRLPGAGEVFQDCWEVDGQRFCGPEMVVVPAGQYQMGAPEDEAERQDNEGPQHTVAIAVPFAVGKFPITFEEWDFAAANSPSIRYRPRDEGWGRGKRPVINVSWEHAQAYVNWLKDVTGKKNRLLSEAEWEYVARAGKSTPFWWGTSISTDRANYDGHTTYADGKRGERRQKTIRVDSFDANPWGLYQVHGNVWEWVEDIWNDSYHGAPSNGSALTQVMEGNGETHVLRGGSWVEIPYRLRAAYRYRNWAGFRNNNAGFRVARSLS